MGSELVEVVADELEFAAHAARNLNTVRLGAGIVGVGIGIGIGFFIGYRYTKKKAVAEAFVEAEEMVAEMRDHYDQKILALSNQSKEDVETLAEERGYIHHDPVQTSGNLAISETVVNTTEGPLHVDYGAQHRKEIPVVAPIDANSIPKDAPKDPNDEWDEVEELNSRNEEDPYIIHQDEFTRNESAFEQESYIYFAGDDVLVNAADPSMIMNQREGLIGDISFNRFGHGADDYNKLYIRNPFIELEMSIIRVPGSWEAEVIGPEPDVSE